MAAGRPPNVPTVTREARGRRRHKTPTSLPPDAGYGERRKARRAREAKPADAHPSDFWALLPAADSNLRTVLVLSENDVCADCREVP